MDLARRLAPEIDRLVLSVNRGVSSDYGRWLIEIAQKAGLPEPGPATYYADFLMAGRLTRDIARRRSPYLRPGEIDAWLDDLVERDLATEDSAFIAATPRLEHLLEGIIDVRSDVAVQQWSAHEATVDIAAMGASIVIEAIGDEFVVAAAHAALPEPTDRYLRLHSFLTTLRYMRQHAHVAAWREQDLDAAQVVVLTELWLGKEADPDAAAVSSLVELGYVDKKHLELTAAGQVVRQMIEDSTNRLAEPA